MITDLTHTASPALTPEDIVLEVKNLPSAPKVLPRLKLLLRDANSSLHEIVSFIRLDPGIAARVLQTANSAYFSKGVPCFTVEEAVGRVGYDHVYELVSYAVASQVLVRPLDAYGVEADELWKMSVAAALAAEALADRTGQDRNVAYTVGLLHCIGWVVIDEWALRTARPLRLQLGSFPREATESERAALGFTQAEVGGALLRHWEFPDSIYDPVRWQYSPRASAGHARMATLLHATKWLRDSVCGKRPPLPEPMQIQSLGLAPSALNALAGDVSIRLARVTSLLDQAQTKLPDRCLFPAQDWRK